MKLIVEAKKCECKGNLLAGGKSYSCALGPAGLVKNKREGDGGTPIAKMGLVKAFYRKDRIARPDTLLPMEAIKPDQGWCDDPDTPFYNSLVILPFTASHEKMWRDDPLYDLCVVLDWNLDPAISGKGSAIFFHLAKNDYEPTEGCIAVQEEHLRDILNLCNIDSTLTTRIVN